MQAKQSSTQQMERLPNRYPKISQSHKVPLYKGLSLFYPKLRKISGGKYIGITYVCPYSDETACVRAPPVTNGKAHPAGCALPFLRGGTGLFRNLFEHVFADAADGANPVFGNLFELRSGGDASVGIAHCGVVYPLTNGATVLFHFFWFLMRCLLFFVFTGRSGLGCKYKIIFRKYAIPGRLLSTFWPDPDTIAPALPLRRLPPGGCLRGA